MVEYTEASVIRVRIAILADAAAYREKEDVGEGVNMYIHTYTRGYIVARTGRTGYNPVESKAGGVCTGCVHVCGRGPRGVRILYGGFQARMGDQCFIDIAADAPLIRLESAVAHI